jgi:hypothetical protein
MLFKVVYNWKSFLSLFYLFSFSVFEKNLQYVARNATKLLTLTLFKLRIFSLNSSLKNRITEKKYDVE